ncbi:MAG: hypothetical protein GX434_04890 [Peptococcaceae bacterium]|nr:hypothetical protein [Peptococcaceae bacterium]
MGLSKAPRTDILQFDINLQAKGTSAIAPEVNLKEINEKTLPFIMGTAIFKEDKVIGFLNGEETKDLLFIKNEVKGGVLVEKMEGNDAATPVSLEIFKSKTRVKPVVDGKDIKINLNIDTIVGVDEIEGTQNFMDDEGRIQLKN